MPSIDDRLLDRENFYFAFKKLSHYLQQAHEWYNPVELAAFEANLNATIYRIRNEIKDRSYRPKPIELLPFPKKSNKSAAMLRPYYKVSLEDQLVWALIAHIIGDKLEAHMPFWSYGNRLYRPLWYEFKDGTRSLKTGLVKNTSENLYRRWNQSWPRYRRHISIVIKTMTYGQTFTIQQLDDEKEAELLETTSEDLKQNFFLKGQFWGNGTDSVHWLGLDFRNFFPSINPDKVIANITRVLKDRDDVDNLLWLVRQMLTFPINYQGWDDESLSKTGNLLELNGREIVTGIPTGLAVAGLLANVALIDVDQKITEWIKDKKSIAIFKYVDDHVVLAKSHQDLIEFFEFYKRLLREENTGIYLQSEKLEPHNAFKKHEEEEPKLKEDASQFTQLDSEFPEPLMTHTLKKISSLGEEEFELADDEDIERSITDLEQFLVTNFPESEIKKDTRMSFAALKLTHIAKYLKPDFRKIDPTLQLNRTNIERSAKHSEEWKRAKTKKKRSAIIERKSVEFQVENFTKEFEKVERKQEKTYKLLKKAVREHPDKIKLWRRCFEFCYHTGLLKIDDLFEEVANANVDPRSRYYIQAYSLLSCCKLLTQAVNTLTDPSSPFWETFTCYRFIQQFDRPAYKNIKTGSPFLYANSGYPFYNETQEFFQVLLDWVFEVDRSTRNLEGFIPSMKISRSSTITEPFLKKLNDRNNSINKLTKEEYLWYILNHIPYESKFLLWHKAIKLLDLDQPISWSILTLFPQNISSTMFQKIREYILGNPEAKHLQLSEFRNFTEQGGVLYEILSSNRQSKKQFLNDYPIIKKILSYKSADSIPLNLWLIKLNKERGKRSFEDPKLSEWTILEIIKQIAQALNEKLNKSFADIFFRNLQYGNIHPSNYLIPASWMKIEASSWDQWRRITSQDRIRIVKEDRLIDDFRYLPFPNIWRSNYFAVFRNGELATMIGLTVLACKLFAKSFEWPPSANKVSFLDQLFSHTLHTIESAAISSNTRLFIGNILSKKDIDLFYGLCQYKIKLMDGTEIESLKDYIAAIQSIQNQLEQAQLSLVNQMPRQLIYVNIDDLNSSNNHFFAK